MAPTWAVPGLFTITTENILDGLSLDRDSIQKSTTTNTAAKRTEVEHYDIKFTTI